MSAATQSLNNTVRDRRRHWHVNGESCYDRKYLTGGKRSCNFLRNNSNTRSLLAHNSAISDIMEEWDYTCPYSTWLHMHTDCLKKKPQASYAANYLRSGKNWVNNTAGQHGRLRSASPWWPVAVIVDIPSNDENTIALSFITSDAS